LLSDEERQQVEVLAVSVDPRDKLQAMLERMDKKYSGPANLTLLSDLDHAVINRYGLLNEAAVKNNRFVPHPTTYVIDKTGKVTWKFTEVDYKVRPSNETIVAELRKLAAN
jgi:peroxiredoxin